MTKVVAIADNKAPVDKMSYPSSIGYVFPDNVSSRINRRLGCAVNLGRNKNSNIAYLFLGLCATRPLKSSPVVVATAKRPSPSRSPPQSFWYTRVLMRLARVDDGRRATTADQKRLLWYRGPGTASLHVSAVSSSSGLCPQVIYDRYNKYTQLSFHSSSHFNLNFLAIVKFILSFMTHDTGAAPDDMRFDETGKHHSQNQISLSSCVRVGFINAKRPSTLFPNGWFDLDGLDRVLVFRCKYMTVAQDDEWLRELSGDDMKRDSVPKDVILGRNNLIFSNAFIPFVFHVNNVNGLLWFVLFELSFKYLYSYMVLTHFLKIKFTFSSSHVIHKNILMLLPPSPSDTERCRL